MEHKNNHRQLLPILSLIILIIASLACQSITPTSYEQSTTSTPKPEGLAGFIVGLWEYKNDEDGIEIFFSFTDNGKIIGGGGNIATYDVVSETTILISYDGKEEVMRVHDFQGNNLIMTLPDASETYIFHRIDAVPNFAEAIIGLWIVKGDSGTDEFAFEFTHNNKVISNIYGIGQYRVLSNNSIELYNLSTQPDNLTTTMQIVRGDTNNSLAFYIGPRHIFAMTRIEEHQNLSERIVGLWRTEEGGEVELTTNGRYIIRDIIADYDVVSNNTIVVEYENEISVYNIINLTNDTLTLNELTQPYSVKPFTLTRVQP